MCGGRGLSICKLCSMGTRQRVFLAVLAVHSAGEDLASRR